MGHYDSCYEAEEEHQLERYGNHFKSHLEKMTPLELGRYRDNLKKLIERVPNLQGTAEQHQGLKYILDSVKLFIKY